MQTFSQRGQNSLSQLSAAFQNTPACWVALLMILARISPIASEEVDCRVVSGSGYTYGPVPDTCTVKLVLNDTESEMISSLRTKYQHHPLRCRVGKYTLYVCGLTNFQM